jgi:hypothetical protein
MLTLLKEVVGAIAVAEILELPRLSRSAPASHDVLIDQNLNGPEVAGEVACLGIGIGDL